MKKRAEENYLERKPLRQADLAWSADEEGNITLQIENKGMANRLAQKLLKKPKVTYIHLDKMGSFIWPLLDGQTDIIALGEKVDAHFGEEAHPLYERLSEYIRRLESYHFIQFK